MIKKISLLGLFLFFFIQSSAQFTNAQKDSVLQQLGYLSGQFSIAITFVPGDYISEKKGNPYKDLSEEQLLAKLTNTFKDADIYKQLCLQYLNEKKDRVNAEKYYNLAAANYNTWMDREFMDPNPFLELLGLLYATQTYNPISAVLNEALVRFPQNKDILDWACIANIDLFKNFDKTKIYINELHALDPYNLNACFYSVMASQYQNLLAINSGDFSRKMDISMALKALEAKPNEVGYQHLVHFAKVTSGYLHCAKQYFQSSAAAEGNYDVLFNSLDTDQKKEFEAAETFFKQVLAQKKGSRLTLLNSLGFVSMYLNKRDAAKKYFKMLYQEEKTVKNLENLILISAVEERWADAEDLLKKSIDDHKHLNSYLSLMGVYAKYLKDDKKQLATVQRLEKLELQDPSKNFVLSTWYLKKQNLEKAKQYCDLLDPQSDATQWRLLALHVISGDKEKAAQCMTQLLELNPSDAEALKIKAQLEL